MSLTPPTAFMASRICMAVPHGSRLVGPLTVSSRNLVRVYVRLHRFRSRFSRARPVEVEIGVHDPSAEGKGVLD